MLKPKWSSLDESEKKALLIAARNRQVLEAVERTFPPDIEASYFFEDLGPTCIRMFINLPTDASEDVTHRAVAWLSKMCGRAERFFREDTGVFAWKGQYIKPDYSLALDTIWECLLFIEHAHAGECAIERREVMTVKYIANCKDGVAKEVVNA